ncbi:MAG: PIN domain-containing protein [bacterium]
MTHLLDTSAVLAYYFEEGGADRVQPLLADTKNPPSICCLTELEFWARLKFLGAEAHFGSDWPELSTLLRTLPLDVQIVGRAVEIRRACSDRLPTVDSLIAATASFHNMVLVHRDPHFESIPRKLLRQVSLCPTTAS